MKTEFKKSFAKDLKKHSQNKRLLSLVKQTIMSVESAHSLEEIKNLKNLKQVKIHSESEWVITAWA